MSYAFDMYFANVENKLAAYEFCDKITKMFLDKNNAKKWIERNKYGIPNIRFAGNINSLKDNKEGKWVAERILEYTGSYWIRELFTFKFFYWEKYGLVGLILNACPKEIANEFDKKVSFQSSCSQDYDYEDWGENITFFKDVIEKIERLNLEELANKVENTDNIFFKENEDNEEDFYLKEVKNDEEFYRKSLVYCDIVDTLNLMGCLYDNIDESILSFGFCAIDSEEKKYEYLMIVKDVVDEMLEKINK